MPKPSIFKTQIAHSLRIAGSYPETVVLCIIYSNIPYLLFKCVRSIVIIPRFHGLTIMI